MARTVASIAIWSLVAGMSLLMHEAVAQPRHVETGASQAETGNGMTFDIPAQPLQNALDAFSALSGFSGLYSAAATAGRTSTPVRGRYTPHAALRLLLEDSGLAAYYTAADAFVLEPAPAAPRMAAHPGNDYFGLLQEQVRDVFCRDPLIAPGNYRIALRFHLDARGRVMRPLLLDSTGDRVRDRAILAALQNVDVGFGPADISQPFFMLILPHTLAPVRDCLAQ